MLSKVNNVYFSGINGIGMSGLAKILAADGFNVAGSDLERKAVIDKKIKLLESKIIILNKNINI